MPEREREKKTRDVKKRVKMGTRKRMCIRKGKVLFCHPSLEQRPSKYGKGTFATKDIPEGEVVLREKLYNLSHPKKDVSYSFRLIRELLDDPHAKKQFLDLVPLEKDPYFPKLTEEQEMHRKQILPELTPEEAHIYYTKFARNAFGFGDHPGFLFYGTRMNHSCKPNVHYEKDGNHMVFRTTCPIRKGDEMLDSYINWRKPREERQAELLRRYGFSCGCSKCEAEK
jgi:hypothetical protein